MFLGKVKKFQIEIYMHFGAISSFVRGASEAPTLTSRVKYIVSFIQKKTEVFRDLYDWGSFNYLIIATQEQTFLQLLLFLHAQGKGEKAGKLRGQIF